MPHNPPWLINRHPNDLKAQIKELVQSGYVVTIQDKTSAQLVRKKHFSCLIATLSFLFFGIGFFIYLFYFLAKKDEIVYLDIEGQEYDPNWNQSVGSRVEKEKKILKVIAWVVGIPVGFLLWQVSIPGLIIWYVWKKTKINKRAKIAITVAVSLLFVILTAWWYVAMVQPPPLATNGPSAEEQAQAMIERQQQEQIEREAAETQAKAVQAQWEKAYPKAAAICAEQPEWDNESCQKLADGMVWIGMTYEMLVYKRGNPTSKDVSDYGDGPEYQACWWNLTPSCFYLGADGVVTAYN